ncbi:RNA-directed DNA polymerase, eukaryota, partial [Tanacetum coccineum]
MGSKDLWQLCDKHGMVADVYIARKLSKIGRRFAFVRFLKVKNTGSLIEGLNKIWIGSYHLFAAMARFEKKPNATTKPIPKPSNNQPNNQAKSASFSSHANPNSSYATALNGNSSLNYVPKDKIIFKSVTLDETDLIDTSDMRNVILAKHITQSFVIDERVVWIEIGGLPLNAWTSKAFKKIDCSWGVPLFVDEDPSENATIGRVCIKTKEFAGWVPDIKAMESLSINNSEMDNSDNHDDDISDNGTQDEEEGEIRNSNVNQEEEFVRNTQWTDEVENVDKNQDDFPIGHQNMESQKQSPIETLETQKDESDSISKPPGFEGYKTTSPQFSAGGNRQSSKQPSNFSSAPVKSSRVSKSHSKSFNNHGSMIEAFISHIEIGNVLGY